MLANSIQILKSLQHPSGLFSAAAKNVSTGYNRAWIRDNVYAALGLEATGNINDAIKAYHALLDIFLKHECKIDWMIKQPLPKERWRYIHARYDPFTGNEILEEWGNKQNDAIGAFLFKIGDLEAKGIRVLRNEKDSQIVQKLVDYLAAIEYWHDADNGMWEENEEIHASSVGACVAGLKKISSIVNVQEDLMAKGEQALSQLLPSESATKQVDLALLSLIYPYDIVTDEQRTSILKNIEEKLLREKGVIRYVGDKYYSQGSEAEWTMGLVWLAVIYKMLNVQEKYSFFMRKAANAMNKKGELPELYYANSAVHNENSPLAWSQSLFAVAAA